MISIARFISAISNPIIISAPFSYILVLNSRGDVSYAIGWTLISMAFSSIVGFFVFFGVKRGFFSDYDVSKRAERPVLFAFTGFVSILYLLAIFLLNGPQILLIGLSALLLGVIIAEIINTKIKASIHLAVFISFAIVLGILYGGIFWLFLLLSPVVAWSRIKLKKHELFETIVGSVVGIIIVLMLYIVVKYVLGFYAK